MSHRGFTLVEMLIVIPIVMLVVGGVITAIIAMTGDILSSRAADTLTYSIQDSFTQIQQDVANSGGYLATNDFSIVSPQGVNNDGTAFTNVGGSNPALILKESGTSENPGQLTSTTIYLANQPNACASANVNQNQPVPIDVVYFVSNNSLWRRVVVPSTYKTAGCSVPWQQASCAPTITGTVCTGKDEELVDAGSLSLGLQYFSDAGATTANATASDTAASTNDRTTALATCDTVSVSITATELAAGRTVSQASSMRATRPAAVSTSTTVPGNGVVPPVPSVSGSFSPNSGVTFSWQPVSLAASYTVTYQTNGGSWTAGSSGTNATSYTVPDYVRNDVVAVRVAAVTGAGSSSNGTASTTIPAWIPLAFQNLYLDFSSPTYPSGSYAMTSDGAVVLQGVALNPSTPISGTVIATLPPAYRPANRYVFQTVASNNSPTRIDIDTSGNILYQVGTTTTNQWVTLNGISYIPAGTSNTTTAFTPLLNGWSNSGSPYGNLSYTTDSDNRVWLSGLVKGGTLTNATPIVNLPSGMNTSGSVFFPASDSNAFGEFGVYTNAIDTKDTNYGGAGTSLSIQAMYYPSGNGTWTNATLANSWVTYGSGYPTAQYTKGSDGIVTLTGMIKNGTTASGTTLFTLPSGYRPASRLIFEDLSNGASQRIDVFPTGVVAIEQTASSGWVTVNSIKFIAEQ